ncbi:MAG: aspartate/glutamate racemase family protein [Ferrovibrio sp.]|uniref:aspartate/glutamate racemase family protein n=1 Tax=Ferrovibrio sp. TaxID=1917215 RepID=UPI002605A404|nr:aspartate/glutamate racemase family protein [Ferrovibrio sp.]MCW0235772.1 aspartate/glutamate racemase family protein [Ferrovibrio sp.]
MKLLLINPNTTATMTEMVLAVARRLVAPGTELAGATGRFGAAYVATRSAYAIAAHAALDAWAEHADDNFDAVLLACFGDPGLDGLRELCTVPVVGMADASIQLAASLGKRFGIVTGGDRWGPMLHEFVASRGLSDRLASVQTVAPTGGDIARDPQGSMALLAKACCTAAEEGADTVILGGAGLAGLGPAIRNQVPVPVIDSTEAAVRMTEAVASARLGKATVGTFAAPPMVPSIGLSPALAKYISGL